MALLPYGPLAAVAEIPDEGERTWKLLRCTDCYREREPERSKRLGVGEE
ncbi:MAG: hypothetical protein MI919_24990 [Holophagales bacterium]|nr:hypothetical protein [Holophagales bacterium]